ncbi:hypothetical protein ABSA28_00296 [Candidatus Hepatincolaceae symbiont of Richtersius coronifer]
MWEYLYLIDIQMQFYRYKEAEFSSKVYPSVARDNERGEVHLEENNVVALAQSFFVGGDVRLSKKFFLFLDIQRGKTGSLKQLNNRVNFKTYTLGIKFKQNFFNI